MPCTFPVFTFRATLQRQGAVRIIFETRPSALPGITEAPGPSDPPPHRGLLGDAEHRCMLRRIHINARSNQPLSLRNGDRCWPCKGPNDPALVSHAPHALNDCFPRLDGWAIFTAGVRLHAKRIQRLSIPNGTRRLSFRKRSEARFRRQSLTI